LFNDPGTTELYTLPYTTLFRSQAVDYAFGVSVTITLGEVTSINSFVPPLYLAENIKGVILSGPGGSGAVVDLGVCYSYLSFGVSVGDTDFENGYGIRYIGGGSVQIKSSDTGSEWVALTNKFGVSGLTDVSASSPNPGDLLIYDSVSRWVSTQISGTSTVSASLDSSGQLKIGVTAEGISVSGGAQVTTAEFTKLQGINSKIQD